MFVESYTDPRDSVKDQRYIMHGGMSPRMRTPLTTPSHRQKWPEDLWTGGSVIYSVHDPDKCLPPKETRNDRVLRFDSQFESGNLDRAVLLCDNTYHLILEYDRNKSESCQWFYFEMKNVRKSINYQFYISGFHKAGGVFSSGSRVFFHSHKNAMRNGVGWMRGGNFYCYGVTGSPANKRRASLRFQMQFPFDNDTVYMCYALPYTFSDLSRDCSVWARSPLVEMSTLCKTVGGRACPMITVTNSESVMADDDKPSIFLTARIHPGESNSSIVMKGLIDSLLGSTPAVKYLLDNYVVKIVPMMCIDGVIEGFYRCSLSGYDLNRVWADPHPVLHPCVWHLKNMMRREPRIAAYIDFHGHSRLHGTFAYGCPNTDAPSLANLEMVFPRIMSVLSDAFCWQRCVFSYPEDARKSAGRIIVRKELGVIQSFVIESSFGGITSGPMSGVLNDEWIWRGFGEKVCEGLYHLLCPVFTPLRTYVTHDITENGLAVGEAARPTGAKDLVTRFPIQTRMKQRLSRSIPTCVTRR